MVSHSAFQWKSKNFTFDFPICGRTGKGKGQRDGRKTCKEAWAYCPFVLMVEGTLLPHCFRHVCQTKVTIERGMVTVIPSKWEAASKAREGGHHACPPPFWCPASHGVRPLVALDTLLLKQLINKQSHQ